MIGRTVSHYRITDRLGGGGMGVVYKAEDLKLGRTVALKFLSADLTRDEEAKRRFTREARAASLLDHPNICTIYDFGEADDDQAFIAMACYDGESLQQKIGRGRLAVAEVLKIVEQIARGLAKAHANGVVHRDIKPGNVMVTTDGVVKIVDFGLAKLTGASLLTQSRDVMGTAAYMAPEQVRGEKAEAPADIWSLGVVFYELLTGRLPFHGERREGLAYAILHDQPPPVDGNADAAVLDPIVRKMLRKDPLQRYQSMDELLVDLAPYLSSSGSGATDRSARSSGARERLRSGAQLGPYRITKLLGSGGMGDVYLASDTRLGRDVAIKVLAPEFSEDAQRRERFKREAKTISSLNHSNICVLFDVGEQEGSDYLVMEYIEGETLAEKLARGPLPLNQLLRLGQQIADALDRAHRQGIVHRDLKPGNVMITSTGAVKLLDFGLAKENVAILTSPATRGPASDAPTVRKGEEPAITPHDERPLTAEGVIIGTLPYMAPEQIEGKSVDARSDIFSLGAILYEMATGKRAFGGKTRASLIVAILDRDPVPISEVQPAQPVALEHVIRKCLSKDPESRWQSARDVATELQWIEQRGASEDVSVSARGRSLWLSGLAAASLALLIAFSVLAWRFYAAGHIAKPLRHLAVALSAAAPLPRGFSTATFAVSPDGSQLVYVGAGEDKPRQLYLEKLDDGSIVPIEGTDGAEDPFFSPDGVSIGYQLKGKLYRLQLAGRTPSVVCEAPFVRGAAWGSDGSIVFSSRVLMRVDASGGVPVPLTALSGDALGHVRPQFLPDGRHVLFTIRAAQMSNNRLAIVDVSTHRITDLGLHGYSALYARDHLFYSSGQTLFSVRFNPESLKVEGSPIPLPVSVASYPYAGIGFFAISRSGALLSLSPAEPKVSELVTIDSKGEVKTVAAVNTREHPDFTDVRMSRDGRWIVVGVTTDDPYNPQIWTCELARASCGAVAAGDGGVYSPDGSMIAYTCPAADSARTLCVMSADGRSQIHKLDLAAHNWFWPTVFDWTADSKSLIIGRQSGAGGDWDLLEWSLTRGDSLDAVSAVVAGPHNEYDASLSPDGRWLLYFDATEGRTYATTFPVIGKKWPVDVKGAHWSVDGKRIYSLDGNHITVRTVGDGSDFVIGPPKPLLDTQPNIYVGDVSPDGKTFIGVRRISGPVPATTLEWVDGFLDHLPD